MAKTNEYQTYYNDLVADDIKFCDTLDNVIKMIYQSGDAEDIMELINALQTLITIKKNQLEDL